MNDGTRHSSGRKGRTFLIVLLALVLGLAVCIALGMFYLHRWRTGDWEPSPVIREFVHEAVDTSDFKEQADALKSDLKELAGSLKEQDVAAAGEARERMRQDMAALREAMDAPLLSAASLSPDLRAELQSAEELLAILDEADTALIAPALALLEERPLSSLRSGDGVRADVLRDYLEFLDAALPALDALIARFESVDLRLLDTDGKLKSYQKKLVELRDRCEPYRLWLPAARAVVGDGGDRLYLLAAQNSSEIRASGGFPGAMGRIRIQNGVLTVSDLQSVYNLLAKNTPGTARITEEEDLLFSERMYLSWDASFSPDFERAASIWALAYEVRFDEPVDGVISCTPAVIPRLLAVLGPITLSNGTELTGENAGRVLGRDLYFQYLGADWQTGGPVIVDGLFSEAARGTLELLLSHLDAETIPKLLPVLQTCLADRTAMVWLADEEEQAAIRAAGWDAGLNRDPTHPAVGIFFNSTVSSKMGWFLDLDPELSAPERNEDGSKTYTLTLRLTNVISPQEEAAASFYILGDSEGLAGNLLILAPAGGRIEEAVTEGGRRLPTASYEGLDAVYLKRLTLGYTPLVIRCRITTAPEAETPLTLMTTPTMQAFR